MIETIKSLVRPNIQKLVPYSSARDEYSGSDAVMLDANENPFNAPYNRYPDPHQRELKEQIASLKNVGSDSLFIGNGSDEAIDLLFRVFCEPAVNNVVAISPSYGMYKVCADINNVEYRQASLNDDFSLNINNIKAKINGLTRLLFICSPNNPTSNSFEAEEILQLASELNLILVLDEAYIDFSSRDSLKAQLDEYPNLVLLQTFSKAWGLAGLRLGICLAHPELIEYMSRVKYPYNMNMLTLNFAAGALQNTEKKEAWVQTILKERKELVRRLKMFRFVEKVYPSDANFLLVKVRKAKKVYSFLVEKKIIVRDRSNVELCDGALRITVGSETENLALTEALMSYQRDFVDTCDL